jgi:nicotinamide mononucleotide transporter
MLWEQISATSLWEWLAVALAIAYVLLAAKQNVWCWPCAFFSTAIYTYLFWQVALPFQSLLNLYYMAMAVYGLWQWQRSVSENDKQVPVKRMSKSWHFLLMPAAIIAAVGLAKLFETQFSSDYLYLDAFLQVASMMTTYLVTQKYIENWLYWILINTLSAWLFWQTGLLITGILFGSYVGFAIYGYFQWQRTLTSANAANVPA